MESGLVKLQLLPFIDLGKTKYKYEIGQRILDEKKDIIIIDRRRNPITGKKEYLYKCNICGYDSKNSYYKGILKEYNWKSENDINNMCKCACCYNRVVKPGINDVITTTPWMVQYFYNKEDAIKYTFASRAIIEMQCPICKRLYMKRISCVRRAIVMKVYKEKQFLVFDFGNGKTVKYDFATGETIGKLGKPVKGLQNQLRGIDMKYIIESCEDKNYGLFLQFVWDKFKTKGYYYPTSHYITNVGTVLSNVKRYSRYEQIFSAGLGPYLQENRYSTFKYSINEIPSSLIKYTKSRRVTCLNNNIVETWSKNPSECCLAYELDYVSLNDDDLFNVFQYSIINRLINTYGYNAKALFLYLDTLKTFEALTINSNVLKEIEDYARMMSEISPKYDKYPRNFLTTHAIACRNYNRLKQQFDEKSFQNRRNPKYECKIGKYVFLYPEKIDDIRSEAVSQNNCVASYVQSVIDGKCHILFMRKKEEPDKSLVTIEVKNNKIVQAKGRFNRDLTDEEEVTVAKWNTKFENMKGIAV